MKVLLGLAFSWIPDRSLEQLSSNTSILPAGAYDIIAFNADASLVLLFWFLINPVCVGFGVAAPN
jgi:hypothetical protein